MANETHLALLLQGVAVWNTWRKQNPSEERPDLSHAPLQGLDLRYADLSWANLRQAQLQGANLSHAMLNNTRLTRANLRSADLSHTNLWEAGLWLADLTDAILVKAELWRANLTNTNLTHANLTHADLTAAELVETNLEQATLTGSVVYGVAAWNVRLQDAVQSDLVITPPTEPTITVDDLEVAQFVYLLLNNTKIRAVVDTITSKAVLILGRFTPERKAVLDALRAELRERGYLPILFDFDKPTSRDLTETISTLAHMARFIIADITEAKSIPQELQAIVPNLPSVAVRPIILETEYEYALFEHFRRYPWVLPVYRYADSEQLFASLVEQVIAPAEEKVRELRAPS
jgi:uncharacterized protein YjbI with pentapeptide repeats